MLTDLDTMALQVMNHNDVGTYRLGFLFAPDGFHWCRFAGKNSADRQRIKRKARK
jgi:hypothetical protein